MDALELTGAVASPTVDAAPGGRTASLSLAVG